MTEGYCPDCDSAVKLGPQARLGQKATCSSCGAFLEVVGLSPVELDWAYDEDEMEIDYQSDEDYEY